MTETDAVEVWQGDDTLRPLLLSVEMLEEHKRNPRRGDVERIAASLRRFGQVRPIVATHMGVVVAGNHTYRAIRQLGWTHIAAVRVKMEDDEAEAYLIADNRIGDVAGYEHEVLTDLLGQLQTEGRLEGTGWTADEVDDLFAQIDAEEITPVEDIEDKSTTPTTTEPLREVVLMYRQAEYEEFQRCVSHLEGVLGTRGIVATTYASVLRMAEIEGYDASSPF